MVNFFRVQVESFFFFLSKKSVFCLHAISFFSNSWLSYVAGVVWLCLLSDRSFNARTYFSENALLPGLVEGEFKNHRFASDFFRKLSTVPEGELRFVL